MTVIVTGAARGIGFGAVEQLLAAGRTVLALDLDTTPLDAIDDARLSVAQGDVADRAFIEAACERAGEISGVVASAGISRPGPSETYEQEQWDAILAINLTAVFNLMRIAARTAVDGASFVAISSVTGSQGFAGRAAYSASKAGIDGLVRALAVEYAPRIRVNSVVPGFILTDIARANIAGGFIDDATIIGRTPMQRWGAPADVASAISFLLSESASWVTGANIPIDGGWLAYGLGAGTE